jgi:hypothetical protein
MGEHCPNATCGSVSKTALKQRTAIMSRQLGLDVRYYTCRKCGVEYGWLNGSLYDGECYAPKEVRIVAAPQSLEREVKDLNEAVQFIQSRGGVVDFPDGIKEPNIDGPKPELVIQKITSNGEKEELPEGWSYNDKGQKVGPLSMDDLFKSKEPPKDESNS